MISRLKELIHQAYQVTPQQDGHYLILTEPENVGKANTLITARVNIDAINAFALYKFDQFIRIRDTQTHTEFELETYAPFLASMKGARDMCDFILFYNCEHQPEKIHAWILNLKSSRLGNNINQMKAGHRLATFLISKLEDIEKSRDPKRKIQHGEVNFVLFALARPGMPPTNARKKSKCSLAPPFGTDATHPLHIQTRHAPRVGPISALE